MTATITLPFWPLSLDCLDWSQDNRIAVVGGENVAVLTPRLKDFEAHGRHWDTTIFQANAFTAAELPLHEPLSNKAFAVGDELAIRQAVAAKWSWPGLTRHRACALAVLTADHTLSIWTLEGHHRRPQNWKRAALVNPAIREYYELSAGDSRIASKQSTEEQLLVKQRIVAFAWAHPLRRSSLKHDIDVHGSVHEYDHFLAASTEAGDILFLRIDSPYSTSASSALTWSVSITGFFNVSTMAMSNGELSTSDQPHNITAKYATELTFGSWTTDDVQATSSSLAYIANGKLFTARVVASVAGGRAVLDVSDNENDELQWHIQSRSDIRGPLHCASNANGQEALVAFAENTVLYMPLKTAMSTWGLADSHHLDDRWDEVSGATFTRPKGSAVFLNIASELSSTTTATVTLPLPWSTGENDRQCRRPWQHAIGASSATYSANLDLAGNVLERTCGITAAPLGNFVATCIFFQPSDAIAYVIESDRECLVNISYEDQEDVILPSPNAGIGEDRVEIALYCLQRHIERKCLEPSGSKEGLPARAESFDQVVLEFLSNADRGEEYLEGNGSNVNRMSIGVEIDHMRRKLLLSSDLQAIRAERIVDMALNTGQRNPPIHRTVVRRLFDVGLDFASRHVQLDVPSRQIKGIYSAAVTKMDAQPGAPSSASTSIEAQEMCSICKIILPFESLLWAKCPNGHQYSRCALSFLAIQRPGTTKTCGVCSLRFLKESYLNELSRQSLSTSTDDDVEMHDVVRAECDTSSDVADACSRITQNSPTLAQALFAAFDVCIHCGGKYVDER